MCAIHHSFQERVSGPRSLFFLAAFWVVGWWMDRESEDGSHLFKMVEACQPGSLKACVKASLLLKLENFSHCLAFFIVAFSSLIQVLPFFHPFKAFNKHLLNIDCVLDPHSVKPKVDES